MREPAAAGVRAGSGGSEIVVEYAGTRVMLEGRVREIVRLLMREGAAVDGRLGDLICVLLTEVGQTPLKAAGGLTFDWGSEYINCTVLHRVRVAAPAAGPPLLTSGDAER